MEANSIVARLKMGNQDFEWYPTTQEIVDSVARWIARNGEITTSILDIGCGNGGFFEKMEKTDFFRSDTYGTKNYESKLSKGFKKYGIEKSNILAEQLPEDVVLYNFKRTGCVCCPYSLNLQEQLDVLAEYLPSERKRAEYIWKEVYEEYRRIGYRLRKPDMFDMEFIK